MRNDNVQTLLWGALSRCHLFLPTVPHAQPPPRGSISSFSGADAVVPQQGSLFDGLCTNNGKDGLVLDLSKISVPPALISASVS